MTSIMNEPNNDIELDDFDAFSLYPWGMMEYICDENNDIELDDFDAFSLYPSGMV